VYPASDPTALESATDYTEITELTEKAINFSVPSVAIDITSAEANTPLLRKKAATATRRGTS